MQFTRIMKSLVLLEFTFCSRDPGKILGFAMWSLGAVAGTGWANSGDVSPESGRGGQRRVLRFTSARFRGLDGDEAAPAVGRTGSQRLRPLRLAKPARGASGGG
jgi:hypothetical protein